MGTMARSAISTTARAPAQAAASAGPRDTLLREEPTPAEHSERGSQPPELSDSHPADLPDRGIPTRGRWPAPGTIHDRWTVADLDTLPDDGLRYEIIDGTLLVSPAPRPIHQIVSFRLGLLLHESCPEECLVLAAPLDWQPDESRSFEPDLLVMRRQDVTPERLTGTPLLLVEIASPSTAKIDRTVKFDAYAEAGVRQYWIVDPGDAGSGDAGSGDAGRGGARSGPGEPEPSVAVYDLTDGTYVLQGDANGDNELRVDGPVPVSVTPTTLIH